MVIEDQEPITITIKKEVGKFGFGNNDNNGYTYNFNTVDEKNKFQNTDEGKKDLFEYFQRKYLQDAKYLGIKNN